MTEVLGGLVLYPLGNKETTHKIVGVPLWLYSILKFKFNLVLYFKKLVNEAAETFYVNSSCILEGLPPKWVSTFSCLSLPAGTSH